MVAVYAVLLCILGAAPSHGQTTLAEAPKDPKTETITLTIATPLAPPDAIFAFFVKPWAAELGDESRGAMTIEFAASSDQGSLADLAALRAGEIGGAWLRLEDLNTEFPAAETFALPFLASGNPVHNAEAAWEFAQKYLIPNAPDLYFIAVHTDGAGIVHSKGRRLNQISKFEGLVAQAPTAPARALIEELGGTSRQMPFAEVPRALARSRIEAVIAPWHRFAYGPALKHIGKHMVPGSDKALTTEGYALVLDARFVDRLPGDLQEILALRSGLAASQAAGRAIINGNEIGRANLMRARRSEVIWTQNDLAPLEEAARNVIADWLAAREADGFPARAWLSDYAAFLAAAR